MSKAKKSKTGRLSWDGRLCDPTGVVYSFCRELIRSEITTILYDERVLVAVASSSGPLRWIQMQDRERVWEAELLPSSMLEGRQTSNRMTPGQRPYTPELWNSTSGEQLLLFNDRD